MSTILQRIEQISNNENIKITQLEREIGASKGVLSRALAKNTDIQSKWLQAIVENYPKYNSEWLLIGKGEMLKQEVNILYTPPYYEPKGNFEIPLYDIDAAANLQTIFDNQNQNILDTIKIPNLPKCDGALPIRGDSMYPLLKSGDVVIFKHLREISNILYGEMYLIDFVMDDDDYLVVKYVNRSEEENHIKLVSYNSHHEPKDIPFHCIRAMALIKASIRINTIK